MLVKAALIHICYLEADVAEKRRCIYPYAGLRLGVQQILTEVANQALVMQDATASRAVHFSLSPVSRLLAASRMTSQKRSQG